MDSPRLSMYFEQLNAFLQNAIIVGTVHSFTFTTKYLTLKRTELSMRISNTSALPNNAKKNVLMSCLWPDTKKTKYQYELFSGLWCLDWGNSLILFACKRLGWAKRLFTISNKLEWLCISGAIIMRIITWRIRQHCWNWWSFDGQKAWIFSTWE